MKDTIEALMGCLLFVCFLVFIMEYSFWIIVTISACMLICGVAEAIKYIWRKITKK